MSNFDNLHSNQIKDMKNRCIDAIKNEIVNIEQLINMESDSDSCLALQFYKDGFNLLFTNLIDLTNQEIKNNNRS